MLISLWKKSLVFGITVLFIGVSVVPNISGNIRSLRNSSNKIFNTDNWSQTFIFNGSPPEEWNKTYGGVKEDGFTSVAKSIDGGYILAGSTNSYTSDELDWDAWLIKIDSSGNKIWETTFGGDGMDDAVSVIEIDDGSIIFCGTKHIYANDFDLWLIKTDQNGNKLWEKTFGTEGEGYRTHGMAVEQTADKGFIIVGYEYSVFGGGNVDVKLIKTDFFGNKIWEKIFGGNGPDFAYDVCQTNDNGYAVIGHTESFGNGWIDTWLIKTDPNGNKEWDRTFGEARNDEGHSIQQTSDNGFIIAGCKNHPLGDLWLMKTDQNGIELWEQTFSYGMSSDGYSVSGTFDGGYIVGGFSHDSSGGFVLILKSDEDGNWEWEKVIGGKGNNHGWEALQAGDEGYIVVGDTEMYGNGESDGWIIKIRKNISPPNLPTITGERHGHINTEYLYTASSIDPDGDQIYYLFDWGNGNRTDWIGPFYSGDIGFTFHTYYIKGDYTIKVKAKDVYGLESDWATLTVTMPCSNNKLPHFLEKSFERFPNAFPILRHLLGY